MMATKTIPIVMAISGDAVATWIIASLAHPGGNVTGTTQFNPEICAKRLELIKEAAPRIANVAIFLNPDNPISEKNFQATAATGAAIGVRLQLFETRRPRDFERAFATLSRDSVDAITTFEDPMLMANVAPIIEAASALRAFGVSRSRRSDWLRRELSASILPRGNFRGQAHQGCQAKSNPGRAACEFSADPE